MANYSRELPELKNLVVDTFRQFQGQTGEFYRCRSIWQYLGEDMDSLAKKNGFKNPETANPLSNHPLTIHFLSVYKNFLSTFPGVPTCQVALTNMLHTAESIEKFDKLFPLSEQADLTLYYLGETSGRLSYDHKTLPHSSTMKKIVALDTQTVDSMNKQNKKKFSPLKESEWNLIVQNADNSTQLFHRIYQPDKKGNEETIAFYSMRQPSNAYPDQYPNGWNVVACGAKADVPGANYMMVQSMLGQLRTSSSKRINCLLEQTHS